MKKLLMIFALLALISMAAAGLPKVGDNVSVIMEREGYDGKVIGMSNNLICIDPYFKLVYATGDVFLYGKDVCFGLGQIKELRVID